VKPTVLVATTSRWIPTARLAPALAQAGFVVKAVCPPSHLLSRTAAVEEIYSYSGVMPISSFAAAITGANPDLIVPGDDLATSHLHQLHGREKRRGRAGARVCGVIERSLGKCDSFSVVYARARFIKVAQGEGVRCPPTAAITDDRDLESVVNRIGLPLVLKADVTSGGEGVRVVETLEDAKREFRALSAPPMLIKAAKRVLIDQDKRLVWSALLRRRPSVNAQAFIAGRDATSLVACWRGTVLASLHFEVLHKRDSSGPATVLRVIDNSEMALATEKTIRRLGLSGLHGFDFVLEASTGNAYLIEINPRTTQVGHLTLGPGRDLPAALYSAVSNENLHYAPKVTDKETIALFPGEWLRDPASSYLLSAYHDVPWQETELVRSCIQTRRKRKGGHSHRSWIHGFATARSPRQ
jgi:Carbamoyl-phosphate synthase L chain, ATP binding domain